MKNILIIGGGAMGSAFTIPCIDNKNRVTITEPYSKIFIKNLSSKNKFHSALKINLSKKLKFRKFSSDLLNEKFDLIVIALSLSGIDFIGKQLKNLRVKSPILVLTKGLKYEKKNKRIWTISEQLIKNYNASNVSVLKGPCLAKELARKNQTSVVIANKNIKIAKSIGKIISTKYYLTEYSKDVAGIEVSSAIKNIYSMIIGAGQSLNSSSNLFQKSILEMKYLIKYFKGKDETISGLAGVGDLYVSAAGGRNSKMGSYLGKGFTFKSAKRRFMPKDTIEGEQLAREIAPFILKKINKKKIPLMVYLLKAILNNKKLKII
ncbi:glycerol-3-phosphate dehydrogenase [Pelagibacterales bacterium SAG-MED12]|jgi:glycerol-3-phosphate dehydrogenase (NAD(P)+)|nr:glycerol-3-phosphate dehydrogenase [Pelagibacterales bacterium SAG-MED12]|tara:strand:+ start:2202 stop:3161 length:960 start_codon:yes stop_codon:yes gene_type:complete